MTDPMDLDRFEALVAAYGATPLRWPEEERAAAERLMRSDPRAAALVARADAIDALLFAHRVTEPSRAYRARVIDSAPRRRPSLQRARLWWTALAFAVAASSGAVAGSAATAALDPATLALPVYEQYELPADSDTSEENAR